MLRFIRCWRIVCKSFADRLVIVGDATWGGWNLSQSTVMQKPDENADVFKATVHLDANKEFKFLTEPWLG